MFCLIAFLLRWGAVTMPIKTFSYKFLKAATASRIAKKTPKQVSICSPRIVITCISKSSIKPVQANNLHWKEDTYNTIIMRKYFIERKSVFFFSWSQCDEGKMQNDKKIIIKKRKKVCGPGEIVMKVKGYESENTAGVRATDSKKTWTHWSEREWNNSVLVIIRVWEQRMQEHSTIWPEVITEYCTARTGTRITPISEAIKCSLDCSLCRKSARLPSGHLLHQSPIVPVAWCSIGRV